MLHYLVYVSSAGEEATVRALYTRIEADPRHKGLIVLMEGRRDRREFPDWSMAFRDLDSPEAQAAPGYSEFLNTPLTAEAFGTDLSRCQKMLTIFKRWM